MNQKYIKERQELFKAVNKYNESLLQVAVDRLEDLSDEERRASLECQDLKNRTALHIAISQLKQATPVVVQLLQLGSNVEHENWQSEAPLHVAIRHKHYEAVEALLQYGADPFCATSRTASPYALAISSQHTSAVRAIEQSSSTLFAGTLNVKSTLGFTLCWAVASSTTPGWHVSTARAKFFRPMLYIFGNKATCEVALQVNLQGVKLEEDGGAEWRLTGRCIERDAKPTRDLKISMDGDNASIHLHLPSNDPTSAAFIAALNNPQLHAPPPELQNNRSTRAAQPTKPPRVLGRSQTSGAATPAKPNLAFYPTLDTSALPELPVTLPRGTRDSLKAHGSGDPLHGSLVQGHVTTSRQPPQPATGLYPQLGNSAVASTPKQFSNVAHLQNSEARPHHEGGDVCRGVSLGVGTLAQVGGYPKVSEGLMPGGHGLDPMPELMGGQNGWGTKPPPLVVSSTQQLYPTVQVGAPAVPGAQYPAVAAPASKATRSLYPSVTM